MVLLVESAFSFSSDHTYHSKLTLPELTGYLVHFFKPKGKTVLADFDSFARKEGRNPIWQIYTVT